MSGHVQSFTIGQIPGAEAQPVYMRDAPVESDGIEGSDTTLDAGPEEFSGRSDTDGSDATSTKLHACINCKKSKVSCSTQRPCPRCVRLQVREARLPRTQAPLQRGAQCVRVPSV